MIQIIKRLKIEVLIYFLLTVILSVVMVSEAFLMQYIIDATESKNIREYILKGLIVIIFLLFQTVVYFFQQFLTSAISKKSSYEYRKIIFRKIQRTPLKTLATDKNNKLFASLSIQIEQLEQNYFYSIYWSFYLICQLTVAVLVSLYINPIMAIFTIVLCLPNLMIAIIFKEKLEQTQNDLIKEHNTFTTKIQDIIDGLIDWKTSNSEEKIDKIFDNITLKLLTKQILLEKTQHVITSLNQLFSNILYFGSWIIGGFFIIRGHLTIGSMVAFSQLLARISFPVYTSSDLLAKYISGKRVLVNLEQEFCDSINGDAITTIEKIEFLDFLPKNIEINKKNNITFQILKGNKYLIKGKSGSGKTTILKSIIKEYDSYIGDISINDKKIRDISETSIYKYISYVSQNPHIFEATVKDNLTIFSNEFSKDQIFSVLNLVELSDWANDTSLELYISKENMKISGGEVKRLALARALLRNTNFLILDEFSSGIDSLTLEKIEGRLFQLDKTILYVSHVTNSQLKEFDKIINLDELNI